MDNEIGEHVTLTIAVVRARCESDVEVDGKLVMRVALTVLTNGD